MKGAHINTVERFYIHVEQAAGNYLNDDHNVFPNKIFNTLINLNTPHTLKATEAQNSKQSHIFYIN